MRKKKKIDESQSGSDIYGDNLVGKLRKLNISDANIKKILTDMYSNNFIKKLRIDEFW